MPCVHLQQLYQLCRDSQVKLSSAELIHIVCRQCNQEEVCPSLLFEQYEEMNQTKPGDEASETPSSPGNLTKD